jgi:hypothetical protein
MDSLRWVDGNPEKARETKHKDYFDNIGYDPAVNTRVGEAHLYREDPIDFIDSIERFKDHLVKVSRQFFAGIKEKYRKLRHELNKNYKNRISFFKADDRVGSFPDIHINFSLWKDDKNIFCADGKNRIFRPFINFLANDLVENLKKGAFYVFAPSSQAFKRLTKRMPTTPRFFGFEGNKTTFNRYHGVVLYCRTSAYPNPEKQSRIEFILADYSGIDSVKVLFIINSILSSLRKLKDKFFNNTQEQKVSVEQLAKKVEDEYESCMNSGLPIIEIFKTDRFKFLGGNRERSIYENQPFPNDADAAFEQFRDSETAKELFGNNIYTLMTELPLKNSNAQKIIEAEYSTIA